jgi:YgiT-type zinc finger domain-containing protein
MKLEKKAVTRAKVCPECGAAMKSGRTTLHFEQDGFYADVENVSALLCGRCGTRSIPGPTAAKISETVPAFSNPVKTSIRSASPSIESPARQKRLVGNGQYLHYTCLDPHYSWRFVAKSRSRLARRARGAAKD